MKMGVKVYTGRCDSYEETHVEERVRGLLEGMELGGVWEGKRVLVKPNLLSARRPEEGITTHPAVVRGVIRYLVEGGAEVIVGDSPCTRRVGVEELWEKTGMRKVCEETGAELVNVDERPARRVQSLGMELYLTPYAFEVDGIVSVPKLKTHGLTQITCGVKNLFGLMPGYVKLDSHKKYHRVRDFSRLLVAILAAVRPRLTVADAVVVMEGNGPASGSLRKVGRLLASEDAVALDAVCAYAMGLDARKIEHLKEAGEASVGEAELGEIELRGADLSELRIAGFKRAAASVQVRVPEFVARLFHRFMWVRPAFTGRCSGCGLCVENCPGGALVMVDSKPSLSPEACIECFCCQESCPHGAVEMRFGALARLFG